MDKKFDLKPETISDIVKIFGKYSCLNMNWQEVDDDGELMDGGVVTIIKTFKDDVWYYFNQFTPEGVLGKREFSLIMTSSKELK